MRCRAAAASRVALAPTLGRRARARARVDARAIRTPASSSRSRARWRSATSAAGARSPPRCPAYLDGDGLLKYFPTLRSGQRGADRLRAGDRAGGGLGAARDGAVARRGRARSKFVEGRHRARARSMPTADLSLRKLAAVEALAAPWRSRRRRCSTASPSSPTSGRPPRCSTGGACCAGCPRIAESRRAARGSRADRPRAPERPGHDDGLLHRAHRQPLVADGLGRRQRAAPRAVPRRRRRSGRTRCRA